MIKHLQIAHTIILETIARKSSSVKRPYKVKLKKEPVVDPETGLIIKHAPSEVRKKRRKEVWQHFESFPQDNTRARCNLCAQVIEMKTHSVTIDLVKHLNSHEIKLELETCSICGKTFDERVKSRHHEKMHTSMKTHPCQHCGKLFRDNSAKERHERTHTGEKPFQVGSIVQKVFLLNFLLFSVHSVRQTLQLQVPRQGPYARPHGGDPFPLRDLRAQIQILEVKTQSQMCPKRISLILL